MSKESIKALLIEKKMLTATQFNERCRLKNWRGHKYSKCYSLIKEGFGIDKALNKNWIRSLVRMLNENSEGIEFVSSKRARMETSYLDEDSADESPLLDLNKTVDMSVDAENIDPVDSEKDRIIEGKTSLCKR